MARGDWLVRIRIPPVLGPVMGVASTPEMAFHKSLRVRSVLVRQL